MGELANITQDTSIPRLLREAAARELAKRENQLFHPRNSIAPLLTPSSYIW